jgi:sensor histidine kinase YesM
MSIKFKNIISVIIISTCLSVTTKAQNPAFISLDNENILPTKEVYDLFEDSKGYIWIGHKKGITKYSGYSYKYFNHPQMKSFELSNILEDKNGVIWCSNFTGQIFYIKNDTINLLNPNRAFNFYIRSGITLDNDFVYLIENQSLIQINIDDFSINTIPLTNIGKVINCSYMDKVGLIIFSSNGVFLYKNKKVKFLFKVNFVNDLIVKCVGNEIFGINFNEHKLYKLNKGTWQIVSNLSEGNADITTFVKIENEIFINTYNGFLRKNLISNKEKYLFKGYCISDEIKDKSGNLWVSTLYNGVFIIPEQNSIKKVLPINENITSICLINDQNKIAVGTKNGKVFILDKTSLNILKEVFLGDIKNVENIYYNKKRNELNISTLKQKIIDLNDYEVKEMQYVSNAKRIVEVDDQFLFVNSSGLSVFNFKKKLKWHNSISVSYSKNLFNIGSNERFFDLVYQPKENFFYAASINNVFCFNNTFFDTIKYKGNSITAKFLLEENNIIYAVENNKGLYIIKDSSSIKLLNDEPLKSISSICISGQNIIVLTNLGLYKINLASLKVQNITNLYNLPSNKFEILASDENYIYATEANTVVKLENLNFKKTSYKTPISISKILVNGENLKDLLNLKDNQNNLDIYFDIINFKYPKNIAIKYKLNEEDDWKFVNANQGQININSLSPGNYTFEIQLVNEIASNVVKFNFIIFPPFYKAWWFIISIIVVSSGLVLLIMSIRIRIINMNNKILLDKVTLEKDLRQSLLTSIRTQMNPHFVFNALNTIQSFIYTNDKKNASEYLVKFSDLTRLILEMSEKESVTLKEEIQALELYVKLESVRFNDMLDYNFIVDANIAKDYIRIAPMIIQPYVENAIKHGLLHKKEDKKLFIYITMNNSMLTITIEDNGVGRVKSNEINRVKDKMHVSFSSNANKKRIEILNQNKEERITGVETIDLYDENNLPIGTRVIIEIPVML